MESNQRSDNNQLGAHLDKLTVLLDEEKQRSSTLQSQLCKQQEQTFMILQHLQSPQASQEQAQAQAESRARIYGSIEKQRTPPPANDAQFRLDVFTHCFWLHMCVHLVGVCLILSMWSTATASESVHHTVDLYRGLMTACVSNAFVRVIVHLNAGSLLPAELAAECYAVSFLVAHVMLT